MSSRGTSQSMAPTVMVIEEEAEEVGDDDDDGDDGSPQSQLVT